MRNRSFFRAFVLSTLAIAVTLAGCSEELTALEGVYEIESWTQNDTGCDSDGASILADQTDDHFYLKAENLFGQEFLNLVLCEGLAACTVLAGEDTINLGFGLDSGSDGAGWTGSGYSLGGSDTCSGEIRDNRLEETAGGELRFEIRRTFVEGVPLDADGFCDSDAAIEMAESQGCEGLEVTTAVQVSDL
jgi:hypothetical protein